MTIKMQITQRLDEIGKLTEQLCEKKSTAINELILQIIDVLEPVKRR